MRASILAVGTADAGSDTTTDPALIKARRMMSRGAWLAALAMLRAIDGQAADQQAQPEEIGAFLSVGASAGSLADLRRILSASVQGDALSLPLFATKGVAACNPLLAFQLMNNFTLCHGAIRCGLQGPNGAFYDGAAQALREALQLIAAEPERRALAGAADSAHPPVTRLELPAGAEPQEAAVVLLLGRERAGTITVETDATGVADVAYVAYATDATDATTSRAGYLAAAEAVGWLEAIRAVEAGAPEARAGGFRFSRAAAGAADRTARRTGGAGRAQAGRAVITGAGAVSAFGIGIGRLWDGLLSGQVAIRPVAHLPGFPASGAVPDAAEAARAAEAAARAAGVRLPAGAWRDRRLWWAVLAAREAWEAAGRPAGLALSLGLGLEQAFLEDFLPLEGAELIPRPGAAGEIRYRSPMDLPARALEAMLPISGARLLHASACAAGTLALAQAAAWVERGEAERVLCGAADSMLNPLGMAGLGRLGVISSRGACRPFDARRDGISVGEGAAIFVVESEDSARSRGAPILARITGRGSSQDAWAPTAPRPGGTSAEAAMRAALRHAGLEPDQIAHVNAHGTGTPPNDEAEAAALQRLLQCDRPISSYKGAIGHAMAAAGALEIAGCLVGWQRGVLPGTAGFGRADGRCPAAVQAAAAAFGGGPILKNSFGFGGQNASLVLEAP